MGEYVLETKNLGISFGGLQAAQNVNIRIKKNQIYGLIGPNGAGKTTIFNLLTCVYRPTQGTFFLDGQEMKGLSPEKLNQKGIARTFQNIRLFNNMTVVRNVMVGLHNQPEFRCNVLESVLRLPRHFKVEKAMRERAKELLRIRRRLRATRWVTPGRTWLAWRWISLSKPCPPLQTPWSVCSEISRSSVENSDALYHPGSICRGFLFEFVTNFDLKNPDRGLLKMLFS